MPDPPEKPENSAWRQYGQYGGMGFEFVAAVVGFCAVGWWIDKEYATSPWGVMIGTLLGISGAMYNAIRSALQSGREFQKKKTDQSSHDADGSHDNP